MSAIVINSLGSSCWCNKSQNHSNAQGLNEQNVCTIDSWTEDGSMWQVISHCIYLNKKNCLCYRHADRRKENYLYFIAAHPGMFLFMKYVNVSRGAHILSNSLLVVVFVTDCFNYSLSFYALFSFNLVSHVFVLSELLKPHMFRSHSSKLCINV